LREFSELTTVDEGLEDILLHIEAIVDDGRKLSAATTPPIVTPKRPVLGSTAPRRLRLNRSNVWHETWAYYCCCQALQTLRALDEAPMGPLFGATGMSAAGLGASFPR
jgi:hypothetical protein